MNVLDGRPTTPPNPDAFSRRDFLRWSGAGAVAALAAGSYGAVASNALVLEEHELRLPKWDADGFRVAIVSDIHANDDVAIARAQKAVDLALKTNPDLIVLPGDFVNFSWSYTIDGMVKSLEALHDAKCPVIGTMGNHDYWTNNPHDIMEALKRRTAMKLLRNEHVEVQGVTIAGLDDAIANRHRPRFIKDLDNRSLLVLLHEPDFVKATPQNASLQISGHSHGGQMCLPLGVIVSVPFGGRRYTKGFYPDAEVPLYVTRGVGTVGAPLRTFCPPEVSLLTLRGGYQ